jgi:quercetin dioxygenase-like cupin family protein
MRKLLLVSLSAFLVGSTAQAQMNPAQMKWGPAPPGLPPGARLAVLSGDPNKQGMFTIRLRFPAGYRVMPHRHPTDELVTVIQGQTSIGMGRTFSPRRATNLVQGGYVALAANMNHYAFTRAGATIQITSHGPFQIVYVNPAHDPRNRR